VWLAGSQLVRHWRGLCGGVVLSVCGMGSLFLCCVSLFIRVLFSGIVVTSTLDTWEGPAHVTRTIQNGVESP